jgi:hypothetical protein
MDLLQNFYETTLGALKETKNERLWFKTNLKLGKLYEEQQDYVKLQKILKELHRSCQTSDGTDDQRKGTQLLEVYALEIQMHTLQKNTKKLKQLYELSLHIKAAIPHPLIMGLFGFFQSIFDFCRFVFFIQVLFENVVVKCIYANKNMKKLIQIFLKHSKVMMNPVHHVVQHV